jgi:hypothetical protein
LGELITAANDSLWGDSGNGFNPAKLCHSGVDENYHGMVCLFCAESFRGKKNQFESEPMNPWVKSILSQMIFKSKTQHQLKNLV